MIKNKYVTMSMRIVSTAVTANKFANGISTGKGSSLNPAVVDEDIFTMKNVAQQPNMFHLKGCSTFNLGSIGTGRETGAVRKALAVVDSYEGQLLNKGDVTCDIVDNGTTLISIPPGQSAKISAYDSTWSAFSDQVYSEVEVDGRNVSHITPTGVKESFVLESSPLVEADGSNANQDSTGPLSYSNSIKASELHASDDATLESRDDGAVVSGTRQVALSAANQDALVLSEVGQASLPLYTADAFPATGADYHYAAFEGGNLVQVDRHANTAALTGTLDDGYDLGTFTNSRGQVTKIRTPLGQFLQTINGFTFKHGDQSFDVTMVPETVKDENGEDVTINTLVQLTTGDDVRTVAKIPVYRQVLDLRLSSLGYNADTFELQFTLTPDSEGNAQTGSVNLSKLYTRVLSTDGTLTVKQTEDNDKHTVYDVTLPTGNALRYHEGKLGLGGNLDHDTSITIGDQTFSFMSEFGQFLMDNKQILMDQGTSSFAITDGRISFSNGSAGVIAEGTDLTLKGPVVFDSPIENDSELTTVLGLGSDRKLRNIDISKINKAISVEQVDAHNYNVINEADTKFPISIPQDPFKDSQTGQAATSDSIMGVFLEQGSLGVAGHKEQSSSIVANDIETRLGGDSQQRTQIKLTSTSGTLGHGISSSHNKSGDENNSVALSLHSVEKNGQVQNALFEHSGLTLSAYANDSKSTPIVGANQQGKLVLLDRSEWTSTYTDASGRGARAQIGTHNGGAGDVAVYQRLPVVSQTETGFSHYDGDATTFEYSLTRDDTTDPENPQLVQNINGKEVRLDLGKPETVTTFARVSGEQYRYTNEKTETFDLDVSDVYINVGTMDPVRSNTTARTMKVYASSNATLPLIWSVKDEGILDNAKITTDGPESYSATLSYDVLAEGEIGSMTVTLRDSTKPSARSHVHRINANIADNLDTRVIATRAEFDAIEEYRRNTFYKILDSNNDKSARVENVFVESDGTIQSMFKQDYRNDAFYKAGTENFVVQTRTTDSIAREGSMAVGQNVVPRSTLDVRGQITVGSEDGSESQVNYAGGFATMGYKDRYIVSVDGKPENAGMMTDSSRRTGIASDATEEATLTIGSTGSKSSLRAMNLPDQAVSATTKFVTASDDGLFGRASFQQGGSKWRFALSPNARTYSLGKTAVTTANDYSLVEEIGQFIDGTYTQTYIQNGALVEPKSLQPYASQELLYAVHSDMEEIDYANSSFNRLSTVFASGNMVMVEMKIRATSTGAIEFGLLNVPFTQNFYPISITNVNTSMDAYPVIKFEDSLLRVSLQTRSGVAVDSSLFDETETYHFKFIFMNNPSPPIISTPIVGQAGSL